VEKLRGLGNTRGQILEFPIEMASHPYNSAALPHSLWSQQQKIARIGLGTITLTLNVTLVQNNPRLSQYTNRSQKIKQCNKKFFKIFRTVQPV